MQKKSFKVKDDLERNIHNEQLNNSYASIIYAFK